MNQGYALTLIINTHSSLHPLPESCSPFTFCSLSCRLSTLFSNTIPLSLHPRLSNKFILSVEHLSSWHLAHYLSVVFVFSPHTTISYFSIVLLLDLSCIIIMQPLQDNHSFSYAAMCIPTERPLGSAAQPQSPRGIHLTAVFAAVSKGNKPSNISRR